MVIRLSEEFPKVKSVIERGMYPDGILVTIAEQQNAQLVMIGDSGHTFWDDLMMGSTTKYVLRHSPCSVWISRHGRKDAVSQPREKSATDCLTK